MSSPLLRWRERDAGGCPAPWLCKGARRRLAGRLLPLPCWKIKEILFCFGMNPRGFEVLGGICWPGKAFALSLSLSQSPPEFQSRSTGINPRRGFLYGRGEGERRQSVLAQATGLSGCAGDQGGRRGRNTPKQRKRENLSRTPICLPACAALHSRPSCASPWAKLRQKPGKHQRPRVLHESAHAGDSEGMTDTSTASLSKIPHHVVSGHLQPWHGVALGPSLYLPCSSSFLEPLLYRILSIPST